ncbi:MAG TPA: proline--tRNA ligase [Gaiellaceae bacterium]|jgi:prolyl-tRNA synthetase|nr:proline--tRNA ligase [Gaiellaceae bacterium]
MLARQSQLFIPTLRDAPADAEAVSHKLLVRGGYIRQVAAGVWTFLPLGWRVHQKVVQIVREEMDAIGGQEMLMPVLTPLELWQQSKRDYIDELFRLKDRSGREYVLPMTHEETVTFHAKEISSYRQLPQLLYHFSIKERDEPRSRGGLLRLREFIMKDAYSFDRDEEGLEKAFRLNEGAYHRMFQRAGLEYAVVQAESGIMGGKESLDFLAPSGSGENTLVTCENGDFAADLEIARGVPRTPEFPDRLAAPKEVATPGVTTIEALAEMLDLDEAATSKAMPVVKTDGTLVLGLVRGDDRLSESKLVGVLGSDYRPATDEEIRAAFGAGGGSLGPVGVDVEIVADETLREGQFVAGANRDGWHLLGVEAGRDYEPRFADIREARDGDRCAACGGALRFQTAIEVGHIFKFGDRYSTPLGATFLDEDGSEKPLIGGSYGVGPARVMAAAVEQHHDENGIVWPASIAPYGVHVLALHGGAQEVLAEAERLAEALAGAGHEVLLDDRDERPGEKFADADLVGAPSRVIVGRKTLEDGAVDVRRRDGSDEARVAVADVLKWVGQS